MDRRLCHTRKHIHLRMDLLARSLLRLDSLETDIIIIIIIIIIIVIIIIVRCIAVASFASPGCLRVTLGNE